MRWTAFLVAISSALCIAQQQPTLSQTPLTTEQVAVYRAFLHSYNNGSNAKLNLSIATVLPDLTDLKSGTGCLKGISLQPQTPPAVHRFSSDFDSANVKLVDPDIQSKRVRENDPSNAIRKGGSVDDAVSAGFAAGLLTLSEIVFDKTGKYAVMSFSFVCGGLCGHGGTIVFEKTNDEKWRNTNRSCSSWIS
jgi:hypothetical protein